MGGPGNALAAAVQAALPAGIAVGASTVRPASPSEPPRRGQHRAGREAAATALRAVGVPTEQPLPRSATGSAAWPAGATGSISHTDRIALAVAGASDGFRRLGIDLEEATALPEGVLELVSSARQLAGLAEVRAAAGGLPVDLVVFSAKEAAAKALGGPEAYPPQPAGHRGDPRGGTLDRGTVRGPRPGRAGARGPLPRGRGPHRHGLLAGRHRGGPGVTETTPDPEMASP